MNFPKLEEYKTKYSKLLDVRSSERTFDTFYDVDAPKDLELHPNPIPLSGGCPDEGFFPIESIHLNVVDEPFQHLDYKERGPGTNNFDLTTEKQSFDLFDEKHVVHSYRYPIEEGQLSIHQGFQYGPTDGFPALKDFSKKLVSTLHKPAYDDYMVTLTNGSGDSLFKVCDLFCKAGGTILVEEFTFTPFNSSAAAYGCKAIPVKLNIREGSEPGIDTDYLDDLLTNWSTGPYKDLTPPTALYTIPTGQNPTGLTQSIEVRKKVYALAEKHDFVILEDDPYGYLVLPKYGTPNIYDSENFEVEQYAKSLTPSYLTIDTSGRVLRMDTYSKLFAPGLRLGFITGNPYLINRILFHTAVSTRSPSGISQVILNNTIQHWGGVNGWLKWSAKVAKHYTIRRDIFLDEIYSSESGKKGHFSVVEPDAGMFIIIYLNIEKIVKNPSDYEAVLKQAKYKYLKHGSDVIFGNRMVCDLNFEGTAAKSHFIRLTIAAAHTNDILREGVKRFCAATNEFFEELEAGKYNHLLTSA